MDDERDRYTPKLSKGIEALSEDERKEILLLLYREVLQRIVDTLLPTIGEIAISALLKSAVVETRERYPSFPVIEIENGRIDPESFHDIRDCDYPFLKTALVYSLERFATILQDLTGDILLSKVEPILEGFKENVNRGRQCPPKD